MLTLDMLYAVLQGLPADHLDYLDRPWYLLAVRIARGLKEGLDPPSALHAAPRKAKEGAAFQPSAVARACPVKQPCCAEGS